MRKFIIILIVGVVVGEGSLCFLEGFPQKKKKSYPILMEIYREVKELGSYPHDDFVKREFFVGEDPDDTNKDIHALILIQRLDQKQKITLQITYLKSSSNDSEVDYMKSVRAISWFLKENKIELIQSDYSEKERELFLPQVLRSIQDKKRLLKLLHHK